MLYEDFYFDVKNECILVDKDDVWYVRPDYRYVLSGMNINDVNDFPGITQEIIGQQLKLQVMIHNKANDKSREIIDFVYQIVKNGAEPAFNDMQNSLAEQFIQFMNEKNKRNENTDNVEE